MQHDVPFSHFISVRDTLVPIALKPIFQADAIMLHDLQSVSQSLSPSARHQSFFDDLPDRTQVCR